MKSNEGLVLVQLVDGNKGNHGIIGPSKRNYGYRSDGDRFYVEQSDAALMIAAGQIIAVENTDAPQAARQGEAPLPIFAEPDSNLLDITGINQEKLDILRKGGHASLDYLAQADVESLSTELDTTVAVARRISNTARRIVAEGKGE